MRRQENNFKSWTFAILFVVGLFVFLESLKAPQMRLIQNAGINFEAPRPKSVLSIFDFDFDLRDVIRTFENPFAEKETKAREVAAKQEETQKAKLQAEAKKAAEQKKANDAKRAQVKVDTVGGDNQSGLTGTDLAKSNPVTSQNAIDDSGAGAGKVDGAEPAETEKKSGRSAAQWRALLSADPSEANFNALFEAYQKDEIEDGPFFVILATALENQSADIQLRALNTLSKVVSPKAFIVVVNAMAKLNESSKAKAEEILLSYGTIAKLNAMSLLMNFPDTAVVTEALRVFTIGYLDAKSKGFQVQSTSTDDTKKSSNVSAQAVQSSYNRFVNVLKRLSQSSNQVVAQAAQQSLNNFEGTQVASL